MMSSTSPDPAAFPHHPFDLDLQCSWHRPTDGRRYHAELRQNLFKEWVLIRRWGTIHSRRGGMMESRCQCYEEGLAQLAAVAKRREQRGYVAVE